MEPYSVLMSVYEKEKAAYFRESIESMLHQTAPADEFVIVCDGPLTKELDAVLKEMDERHPGLFQIVRLKENRGLGRALRQGVECCRHELIARMDSDDVSVLDRCEKQLRVFAERDVDLVGGIVEEFADDSAHPGARRSVPQTDAAIKAFARRRNPFNHPTMMLRRSSVLAAGNYRDCEGFEDYFLWARMLLCGMHGYNIQETLVRMRVSEGMYRRRGSFRYALLGIKARWRIHRIGYSGFLDFLISAGAQFLMSIVPLGMRTFLYQKLLRGDRGV